MARLGYLIQSVSIAVVFFAALACASGDTEATKDAGQILPGAGGTTGSGGTTGTSGTDGTEPTAGIKGSGGAQASGGSIDPGSGGSVEPSPVCPNDIAEPGEVCDGSDLAGASCATLMPGYVGDLACQADCQNYDTSGCYEEVDGAVEAGAGYGG